MQIETVSEGSGAIRLTLTLKEARYLRLALERATFLDTPPQHQREIYSFADGLLRKLEAVADAGERPA